MTRIKAEAAQLRRSAQTEDFDMVAEYGLFGLGQTLGRPIVGAIAAALCQGIRIFLPEFRAIGLDQDEKPAAFPYKGSVSDKLLKTP